METKNNVRNIFNFLFEISVLSSVLFKLINPSFQPKTEQTFLIFAVYYYTSIEEKKHFSVSKTFFFTFVIIIDRKKSRV